jgi:hypothetical protein
MSETNEALVTEISRLLAHGAPEWAAVLRRPDQPADVNRLADRLGDPYISAWGLAAVIKSMDNIAGPELVVRLNPPGQSIFMTSGLFNAAATGVLTS